MDKRTTKKTANKPTKQPARKQVKQALSKLAISRDKRASHPKANLTPRAALSSKHTPQDAAVGKSPRLLAGDNPQIAKAVGDAGPAAVQTYIQAVPGWKRDVCQRVDDLICEAVPHVRKAVKWNSPFYGSPDADDREWFMSMHCFTNYVKVGFFRGTQLSPLPPGESKQAHVRYLDIYEKDDLNKAQFMNWVRQASKIRGERM